MRLRTIKLQLKTKEIFSWIFPPYIYIISYAYVNCNSKIEKIGKIFAREEDLQKERDKLVKKGIYNSNLYQLMKDKLEKEFEDRVAFIRDCLLFFLRYSSHPNDSGLDAPYEVNYAQSYEARFNVLKKYYTTEYEDPMEAFEAFKLDKFALNYLGELHAALYDYLRSLAGA